MLLCQTIYDLPPGFSPLPAHRPHPPLPLSPEPWEAPLRGMGWMWEGDVSGPQGASPLLHSLRLHRLGTHRCTQTQAWTRPWRHTGVSTPVYSSHAHTIAHRDLLALTRVCTHRWHSSAHAHTLTSTHNTHMYTRKCTCTHACTPAHRCTHLHTCTLMCAHTQHSPSVVTSCPQSHPSPRTPGGSLLSPPAWGPSVTPTPANFRGASSRCQQTREVPDGWTSATGRGGTACSWEG